jgi:hypothetical protein
MKYLIVGFLIAFSIVSCKKEAPLDNVVPLRKDKTTIVIPVKNNRLEILIEGFIKQREAIKLQLDSLSPEEANNLYISYCKTIPEMLVSIEKSEQKLLDNYYGYFYNENGSNKTPPDSIKYKLKLINKAQLYFDDDGEGTMFIALNPEFYLNIFKNYVTDDFKEYIELEANDSKVSWTADAGIIIPWDKLAERVINWENFIKRYPDSQLLSSAKETRKYYQDAYLFGMDNTGTYEYSDYILYPENIAEFKRFIKYYPDSPTAKFAEMMLKNNGKNYDAINKLVQKQ